MYIRQEYTRQQYRRKSRQPRIAFFILVLVLVFLIGTQIYIPKNIASTLEEQYSLEVGDVEIKAFPALKSVLGVADEVIYTQGNEYIECSYIAEDVNLRVYNFFSKINKMEIAVSVDILASTGFFEDLVMETADNSMIKITANFDSWTENYSFSATGTYEFIDNTLVFTPISLDFYDRDYDKDMVSEIETALLVALNVDIPSDITSWSDVILEDDFLKFEGAISDEK